MSQVIPTLTTHRLRLRPFAEPDEPGLIDLLRSPQVADGMLSIPSPYPPELARSWILSRAAAAEQGQALSWAITLAETSQLLGGVTLSPDPGRTRAELGYWLGVPFWGRGYASEALPVILEFGYDHLGLHRIQATVFPRNRASARVLEKSAFRREGVLRGFARKGDTFEDLIMYARLRTDETEHHTGRPH
ncbi:GNAT family N-acetyltransferase (plasmid) [Deinococcus taeanensis]|uniref:GNAT family N-acetyltransferase n=1 Tax=Deinococcus taeanensis TaxID=2737050 RepID=UPI001CDB7653|nr:GNAT family N-acetyltransferase [Deinococcus taeanensis]UBV44677.1 GNAT family N-acetyltransferase [Deinococcus taeanensis]